MIIIYKIERGESCFAQPHLVWQKQKGEQLFFTSDGRTSKPHQCLWTKTILWIGRLVGKSSFKRPTQGLDCCFCCWTAGQGLATTECVCSQTPALLRIIQGSSRGLSHDLCMIFRGTPRTLHCATTHGTNTSPSMNL